MPNDIHDLQVTNWTYPLQVGQTVIYVDSYIDRYIAVYSSSVKYGHYLGTNNYRSCRQLVCMYAEL